MIRRRIRLRDANESSRMELEMISRVRSGVRVAVAVTGAALALAGCGRKRGSADTSAAGGEIAANWTPAGASAVNGIPADAIKSEIQKRLDAKPPAPLDGDVWSHVGRLYKAYGNIPLWLGEGGLDKSRATDLTDALLAAPQDALDTDAYPIGPLARALVALKETKNPTAAQYADVDVLLTGAYAALGEDLLRGQIEPKKMSQDWHIDPTEDDVDSALARSFRSDQLDKALAGMRPQDPAYAALEKELGRWRGIAAKGWPTVPEGAALKPGEIGDAARLNALRTRLAAEGIEIPPASASPGAPGAGATATRDGRASYDRGLAGAVAEYQRRHSIGVDSILGAETVNSLNLSATYRLQQIAANLERYRWLPRSLGSRYIFVNVPAFQLTAFDQGKPALQMKVIVGEEYEDKKTPVFSDSMQYVVFRPYWLITPDIQKKEIEPKVAADPGYMAANDLEYYDDHGTQRIRQLPGAKNSLGLVKFMFPNDFNIYLHDTPEGELFKKDVRAFSHGCIRLEKPAQLAEFVLGWPADRVEQQMHDGPNDHTVRLPHPIPVYITYFTTFVADGQLHFGNDLYSRDDEMTKAVAAGAQPSQAAVQAIEALRRIAAR